MACPASFALGLQMPDAPESPYATEGSRLHDVAAGILQEKAPALFAASHEDIEFLRPYLNFCRALMIRTMTEGWQIETRMTVSPLLGGTADFLAWGDGILDVVDLKTGAGVAVDPDDNKQLMTYAGMALRTLDPIRFETVRLTIVQPPDTERPVKTWVTTPARVMAHMAEAQAAIDASLTPAQTPVPGDHCRWCKAKPICPTLRGMVAEVGNHTPATLQPDALATWLDRADKVEGFIADLRTFAHKYATTALAQQRPGIPGYALKPKRAMRTWANADSTLAWARKHGCVGQVTDKSMRSPTQVEKKNPALYERLADQVVAVSSGTNLVKGATEALGAATAQPSLAASLSLLKHRI